MPSRNNYLNLLTYVQLMRWTGSLYNSTTSTYNQSKYVKGHKCPANDIKTDTMKIKSFSIRHVKHSKINI